MKSCVQILSMAAVLAACASAAAAENDQWLQYRVTGEGSGYRWLELSSQAPAGVALPTLQGKALFAKWTTPLDPKGRWACLDRTRKSGPPNRLYLDRNGDGRLADETPIEPRQIDAYSATFEPARLVFRREGGSSTYHLNLRAMRYSEDDARLLVSSGCEYFGKVTVGGKKVSLRVQDRNANGTFNDISDNPEECDGVLIEGGGSQMLGQFLEIKDQLFALAVAQDGSRFKVEPARDVKFGKVRVPEAIAEFSAVGRPGHFVRKPAKGEFTLPVGDYRVNAWRIDRKDAKGVAWTMSGQGFGETALFRVQADQITTLNVGEPLQVALTASERKGGVTFSLKMKGALGESVTLLKGQQQARPPQLLLASQTGTYRATNSFEYG